MKVLVFCFLLLSLISCQPSVPISMTDSRLELVNGELQLDSKPFTGICDYTDELNQTECAIPYRNGRKHGLVSSYYSDGTLAEQRLYDNGIKVGMHQGWWPSGQLKFELYFDKKGRYHGGVKEWFPNGQLLKSLNYQRGREEGPQKMWDRNGKIRANYVALKGDRFGLIGLKKCRSVRENSENSTSNETD